MDQAQLTQAVGGIRTGIGAALLVVPGVAGRTWIGPGAASPGAKVLARAVGARDVVVGLRTLEAAGEPDRARLWLHIGFLSDAADVAAAVLAWRQLTPLRRLAVPLVAGAVGAAGYQAWRATRPDDSPPSPEEVMGEEMGEPASASGDGTGGTSAGNDGSSSASSASPAGAAASGSGQLDEERLLSLEEAAEELGSPVEQVRAMVDEGLLEAEPGTTPPRFRAATVRAAHNLGG